MRIWLIFAGMAAVTYFTRYAMLAWLGGDMPDLLRRWLRYVPPAVLAALIVPAALAPQGQIQIGLPAVALLVGGVVAWRTRNVLATIISGLAAYWLLTAMLG